MNKQQSITIDQIKALFDFRDMGGIDIGENCHYVNGFGCVEEVVSFVGEPAVSLDNGVVTIGYHVERGRIRGECAGETWDKPRDPEGAIEARASVRFELKEGKIKLSPPVEIRSNPADGRPSWGWNKVYELIMLKNGVPIDYPEM